MDRVIVQPTIDGGEFKIERWHTGPSLRVYVTPPNLQSQTFYRVVENPELWAEMLAGKLAIVEYWRDGLTYVSLESIGELWCEFSDFNTFTGKRTIHVRLTPDVARKLYNFVKYPPDPNLSCSWSARDAFETIRRAFPDVNTYAIHTFTTTARLSELNHYELLPAFGKWYKEHKLNLLKSRILFKVAWWLMAQAAKAKSKL